MELNYFLSNGGELTLFGVTGWTAVFLFILIVLIAAWRMTSYTDLAEKSPYLQHLEHHTGEGGAELDKAHSE